MPHLDSGMILVHFIENDFLVDFRQLARFIFPWGYPLKYTVNPAPKKFLILNLLFNGGQHTFSSRKYVWVYFFRFGTQNSIVQGSP